MLTSMEKHFLQTDSNWQGNLDDIQLTSEKARREISTNREDKLVYLKWQLNNMAKLSQGQN